MHTFNAGTVQWDLRPLVQPSPEAMQATCPMMRRSVGPIQFFLTPYTVAEFHPDRFGLAGILCPSEILGSVRKRQAEYFHGRLCARRALQELGVTGYSVVSGHKREPIWPPGIIGSITHNDRFAAAAALPAGPYSGVGIDVESVITAATREAVLELVLGPSERTHMRTQVSLPPDHYLSLAFSAKESFFKAAFNAVGSYFDFDAVTLTEVDTRAQCISLSVNEALCSQFKRGSQVHAYYDLIDAHTVITGVIW